MPVLRFAFPGMGLLFAAAYPGLVSPALAQDKADTPPSASSAPTQTTPANAPLPQQAPDLAAMREKFARIDALKLQGDTTDFASVADTILGDKGDWRSNLADNGFYARSVVTMSFAADTLGGKNPDSPQKFNGHKPTETMVNENRLSYHFARSGSDISQINVGLYSTLSTWVSTGPNNLTINRVAIYNTFFDRKIEIDLGSAANTSKYVGIFAGGNPILATGLAGSMPVQAGMSTPSAPTPFVNVQINGSKGLYLKGGVQRSIDPAGAIVEAQTNGIGFDFFRHNAKALYLAEVGILRPASPNGRQMWLRAGYGRNMSRFQRFDEGGSRKNRYYYALADYQIYKPSDAEPYRGVFLGGTAQFAPPSINALQRNLEARVYAIGMVPGRHSDAVTMTVGQNLYGRPAAEALARAGQPTERKQFSVSVLYAAHIGRGIFLAPNITYFDHPAFNSDYGSALSLGSNLLLLF